MRARPSLARGPALACACESVSGECIRSAALASAILFQLPSPRRAHRLLYAVHTLTCTLGTWCKCNHTWLDCLTYASHCLSLQLNKIDKMVMINGDGDLGASKVTAEVARVMSQVPDVVESLTGVQLKSMLAGIDQ